MPVTTGPGKGQEKPRRSRSAKEPGDHVATERIAFRIPETTAEKLRYWSAKRGMSMNEYVLDAIRRQIAWENQDYPLPTLEQARLNQLVAGFNQLAANQGNLERIITAGFDSLLGLTRGENYLIDDEDGELE